MAAMKVTVFGAGAIGGWVAGRLALAGEQVTVVARGANLQAIGRRGLTLRARDGSEECAAVAAVDDPAPLGAQDLVILAVKAHQLPGVAAAVQPLIGPETLLVPMQNGIPYWYFHRHGGVHEGRVVTSVDPQGDLAALLPPGRVLGCVVYPACELVAPGVVQHVEGRRFALGELDGSTSERAQRVADAFVRADLDAPLLENIRAEIWLKLWGNLTFNPISGLAHATLEDICRYAPSRELAAAMMREAEAVALALGITFRVSLDKRIAGAERVGKHKTSMLQDIEAGREPEIDALVGSVIELARLTDTPVPRIEAVYALVKLLAQTMESARARVQLQALAPV